ncbi:MAG: serine/threonine protein kinase [Anaerolineales bacterium]|nr:serine/threonine protein kinase [Anaerolineales bacterium]
MTTNAFTSDPLLDTRLGNYRIVRSLGMGGMGTVYFAQDETLKRAVALKVMHEQFRSREDYRIRLLSEASAIANLKHPNIVQIYTAGEHEGILYFAMELISGRTLKELMSENLINGQPVNFEGVIQIGTAIAAALDYAHEKGVIHRDVKPANILITADQHVYLTDFGLALDVRDPHGLPTEGGTPQYMSPEQIDHAYPVGPASDQYALGVVLYEIFAGTIPFDGDDAEAIYQQHLNNPPPKPLSLNRNLTQDIQEVLLRALSKHPADRYENCTTFLRHLTVALSEAAEESTLNRHNPLPAFPAGTRKKHGLPTSKPPTEPRPEQKPRANDLTVPVSDSRVTEITRPRTTFPPTPPKTKAKPPRRDDRLLWLSAGALSTALILAVLFFSYRFLSSSFFNPGLPFTPTPVPSLSPTPLPSATFPSIAPPTPTPVPPTAPPPAPTETPTPVPSATPRTGDPFLLLYDDTSFNLLNLSTQSRNISLLKFERVDPFNTILETFTGLQWARFNAIIRPETCMRIKISNAPFLTIPEACNNIFDAEITIALNNESDFWTTRADSNEFRVLWSGAEIQRCPIGAQQCEILIP